MSGRLLNIAERIAVELNELQRILERVQEGWRRAQQSGDDFYLDSVALNLHSLYGGLERLFELVVLNIDDSMPHGANWHRTLLNQVAMEVPGVRPALISEMTCEVLDEYRGFRHVVRYVYSFRLDATKIRRLVEEAPNALAMVSSELMAFANFLKQKAGLP